MSGEFVTAAVAHGVGTITLSRPTALNALNEQVLRELRETLAAWELSDDVDVVVLTGAGEKAFAAGADISELVAKGAIEMAGSSGMQEFFTWITNFPKPTIAAVNGFAFGGGLELALACDIRIASDNAKLGLPELSLGIIPGAGGTQLLTNLAGRGPALFHILTGLPLGAEEARAVGIVSEVTTREELLGRAAELAQLIRTKGPLAARLAKLAVGAAHAAPATGLLVEKLSQAVLFSTADAKEGMSAFLEKRNPAFTDVLTRKDGTVA
ncbi:enoyl-CoA hydratase-related protein [Leucobacter sp. BZR 635]